MFVHAQVSLFIMLPIIAIDGVNLLGLGGVDGNDKLQTNHKINLVNRPRNSAESIGCKLGELSLSC